MLLRGPGERVVYFNGFFFYCACTRLVSRSFHARAVVIGDF